MELVQSVSDATGQTVVWVPFMQAHYRRACFDSFPKREKGMSITGGGLPPREGSAKVFADHLDANIASGPFFSVEFDRPKPFKVSEVFSELLSWKSLLLVSRIDIA